MTRGDNTRFVFLIEVSQAFRRLGYFLESDEHFEALMLELGWASAVVPPPLLAIVTDISGLQQSLEVFLDSDPVDPEQAADLVVALRKTASSIDDLRTATFPFELSQERFGDLFPRQLVDTLLLGHLRSELPWLFSALKLLGAIRSRYRPPLGSRLDYNHDEIAWADLPSLLSRPLRVFENAYSWGDSNFDGMGILDNLQDFFLTVGIPCFREQNDPFQSAIIDENPTPPTKWYVAVPLFEDFSVAAVSGAGVRFLELPATPQKLPGLAILPYVQSHAGESLALTDHAILSVRGELDIQGGVGLILRPGENIRVLAGLNDPENAFETKGMLTARIDVQDPERVPITILGTDGGTRFEAKSIAGSAGWFLDEGSRAEMFVETEIQDARIVVAPGEGDGFLKSILPADGLSTRFDLGIGLSTERGFYLRGSGSMEATFPVHRSVGPIEVESVSVAVVPDGDKVPIEIGAALGVKLGPFAATVEGLGLGSREQ